MFKKEQPQEDEELANIVQEVIDDKEWQDINTKDEELAITNEKLYEKMLCIESSLNDIDKHITHRKEENLNVLKMIFDRLKRITTKMNKWFIGILLVSFVCGGVTFTTIYHNWDNIEPKIDKILGIVKIADKATNIPR